MCAKRSAPSQHIFPSTFFPSSSSCYLGRVSLNVSGGATPPWPLVASQSRPPATVYGKKGGTLQQPTSSGFVRKEHVIIVNVSNARYKCNFSRYSINTVNTSSNRTKKPQHSSAMRNFSNQALPNALKYRILASIVVLGSGPRLYVACYDLGPVPSN